MTLHHTLPLLEVRAHAQGLVEGYASVFGGVDSYGDTILPGAYEASLADHKAKGTAPVMLWSHDMGAPIGRWTSFREDARGLVVAGQLNLKTSAGKEAFEHLQAGDLNGLSIGYRVAQGGAQFVNGVRQLAKLDLHEISVVSVPADPAARITSVKSSVRKPATVRELEDALELQLGFTRREAKTLIARGYAAIASSDPSDELIQAFKAASLNF